MDLPREKKANACEAQCLERTRKLHGCLCIGAWTLGKRKLAKETASSSEAMRKESKDEGVSGYAGVREVGGGRFLMNVIHPPARRSYPSPSPSRLSPLSDFSPLYPVLLPSDLSSPYSVLHSPDTSIHTSSLRSPWLVLSLSSSP